MQWLLQGCKRGRAGPLLDKAALVAALCAAAGFAAAQPEIATIKINPFPVRQQGGVALRG